MNMISKIFFFCCVQGEVDIVCEDSVFVGYLCNSVQFYDVVVFEYLCINLGVVEKCVVILKGCCLVKKDVQVVWLFKVIICIDFIMLFGDDIL